MFTVNHIEDALEFLAGFAEQSHEIEVQKSDIGLIRSIARQTFRGTALTDRQCELVKTKLIFYADELFNEGIEIANVIDQLRMPLRELDRTKSIKLDDNKIRIKFVFNKKYIGKIEELRNELGASDYNSRTKTHTYDLNEKACFEIIDRFNDCSFEIDKELQEWYEKIKDMKNNKSNYMPGIYGLQLKNIAKSAVDYMISDIGEPTIENLALFRDRADTYGLYHFDREDLEKSLASLTELSQKIILRSQTNVMVNSDQYTYKDLFASILELNRMPMIVLTSEKYCWTQLYNFSECTDNIVFPENISVMFRLDNSTEKNKTFNMFVKEKGYNTPLDKQTKIVYSKKNEIPKTIVANDWQPKTAIILGSERLNDKVDGYIKNCDLIIHYDNDTSPFFYNRIEKL